MLGFLPDASFDWAWMYLFNQHNHEHLTLQIQSHNYFSNCLFHLSQSGDFLIHDFYHRVCDKSNTTGVTCGAGTSNLQVHLSSHPAFSGVLAVRYLVFCVIFLPLCCLPFVDLWFLISPLVSSNFS